MASPLHVLAVLNVVVWLLAAPVAQQFSNLGAAPAASYFAPTDMDGDGLVDILDARPTGIWLHRNDGTNRLGTGVRIADVNATPVGAFADFDGDGSRDLIAFAQSYVRLYLVRNTSTGYTNSVVFVPPVAALEARFLRALDLENDGDMDLVGCAMAPGGAVNFYVIANDGSGGFTDVTTNWWPNLPPQFAEWGMDTLDVDSDGRMDLLLHRSLRLLRNTGNGFVDETALRLPTILPLQARFGTQGDFDGDGDSDLLVYAWPPALWRNTAGVFIDVTATQIPPGTPPFTSAAFFDADGDTDLDLYLGLATNGPSLVLSNLGSGGFAPGVPAPWFGPELNIGISPPMTSGFPEIRVADLENDGDQDLVFAWNGLGVLRNAGAGRLIDPLAGVRVPGQLAVPIDIDGDADVDLLQNGQYAENDGFGAFTLRQFAGPAPAVNDFTAVGDIDGDGDRDLASAGLLYRNNGGASFAPAGLPVGAAPTAQRFGDYDGDGDLDLAVTVSWSQASLRILHNDGLGNFTLVQTLFTPGEWFLDSLDAGDHDDDGDLDLLLAGSIGQFGGVVVVTNQGAAGFAAGPSVGQVASAFARFADLTGSGSLDIVLDHKNPTYPSRLRIFRQQGNALVDVTSTVVPTGFSSLRTTIGDVDGDGDLDLCGHQLLRNTGTGTFALEALGPTPNDNDSLLTLVDLDRDGDLDLLRRTRQGGFSDWNYLAWNLEHQLGVPLPPKHGRSTKVEVNARPGRATAQELAFLAVGMQRQALGLPTPFGEIRISPIVTTWVMPITPVVGSASIDIAIPANPAAIGVELHFQALHYGPDGFRLGNVASTTVE